MLDKPSSCPKLSKHLALEIPLELRLAFASETPKAAW